MYFILYFYSSIWTIAALAGSSDKLIVRNNVIRICLNKFTLDKDLRVCRRKFSDNSFFVFKHFIRDLRALEHETYKIPIK